MRVCRRNFTLAFLTCIALDGPSVFGADQAPNLLKNGGFEQTATLTEKEAAPYLTAGWSIGGALLLPEAWNLKHPHESPRFVPGSMEVMVAQADAKEGKNCLKLSTPEGISWLRTTIAQEFEVPESRTIEWSYWARGHLGLDEKSTRTGGADWPLFYYLTPHGYETAPAEAFPMSAPWAQRRGKVFLKDCSAKKGLFLLVTFQGGAIEPAVTYFDDVVLRAAPAAPPPKAAEPPAPPSKPVQRIAALIARSDYETVPSWAIPKVCGKDFWHMSMDYKIPSELDRFPKLADIFKNMAFQSVNRGPPPQYPNAPFFIETPRWLFGTYCDRAGSTYFRDDAAKVVSFRPKKTINGVKGLNLDGWRAAEPLPQSILYDFYDETFIESVRVYPAFGEGRKTRYTIESSVDGKSFETVGEKQGEPTREGDPLELKRKLVFLRITVHEDSTKQAHLIEAEFFGEGGKRLAPAIVSATSEAAPLNEKGIPTTAELRQALKKKYGDRFLGFIIHEFDNCFMMSLIAAMRNDQGKWYGRPAKEDLHRLPFRPRSPKNGQETYDSMKFGYERIMDSYGGDVKKGADLTVMLSWQFWEHYAAELGSAMVCSELPSCVWLRPRSRLMFSRSAARQYRKPWVVYMTTSLGSGTQPSKHFLEKKAAGIYKGEVPSQGAPPWAVSSETLFFRYFLLAYIMGCNFYEHEDAYWLGTHAASYRTNLYDDLAPYGRAFIRAHEFTQKLGERGVPYTPVAFGLDYLHGLSPEGPWTHGDSASWAEAGRPYKMYWETLDTMLPRLAEGFQIHPQYGIAFETDNLRMSNSHCGDAFDVLLPNPPSGLAPQAMFDAYKAIVLLGNIGFTTELSGRFKQFVQNGGTLLVNPLYLGKGIDEKFAGVRLVEKKTENSRDALDESGASLGALPAGDYQEPVAVELAEGARVLVKDEKNQPLFVVFPQGKGFVVTCTVPEMLSAQPNYKPPVPTMPKGVLIPAAERVMERLHDEAIPFRIEGDIEFLLNRLSDGWLVTLINNRGIYKETYGPVVREDDKTAIVRVSPKETVNVTTAMELMEGNTPSLQKAGNRILAATVAVPPGDVRVVKLSLGR